MGIFLKPIQIYLYKVKYLFTSCFPLISTWFYQIYIQCVGT